MDHPAQVPPAAPVAPEIDAAEAIGRVGAGAPIIDVREQGEWDSGHAPTAQFLPMSAIQDRLGEVPSHAAVLIVCHSGARSLRVTEFLVANGIDATSIRGGMLAWQAAGGAVTTAI